MTALLRVENLFVSFNTEQGVIRAVNGVSIEVQRGEILGLVGESGSGKTVLGRAAIGAERSESLADCSGSVDFDGNDLMNVDQRRLRGIWGRRIGVVSQNPMSSLNPVRRVGAQICDLPRHRMGMPRRKARLRALELLDQVGIPEPLKRFDEYPHQMSGGMRQRVAIAMALAGEPELLIADEPTTALDVTIQAQILDLLRELQRDRGMTMIFVSHDLAVVAGLAERIAVMYAGRIVELGAARQVITAPRMPYTRALITSSPRLDAPSHVRLEAIPGRPPNLVGRLTGCPFAPRCAHAEPGCTAQLPTLELVGDEHYAACLHPLETVSGR